MPTTKSAKKRLRQNVVRRGRNRSTKSSLKSQVKKVRDAIASGDAATMTNEFRLAAKKLDKAAATNVIHRNAAARTKSRLSAAIKSATKK